MGGLGNGWRPTIGGHIYSDMRRLASIALLLAIWLVSLAALALGLDGLVEHPPFVPHALLAGAYFGALSTVSLAEEIAEALGRRSGNRTGSLPCRREGWSTCDRPGPILLINYVDGDWRSVAAASPSGSSP